MPDEHVNELERIILELLEERGADKTICPSEAARRIAELAGYPERWRAWLNRTRATVTLMEQSGKLVVLQSGEPVSAATARGPIRLGLPPRP